jgi:hypothetical protein
MKRQPRLQKVFFVRALEEKGFGTSGVRIRHQEGKCFHPKLGWRDLTFPMSLVTRVQAIDKTKLQDYCFMGQLTPKRQWLAKYPNVSASQYGRECSTKYEFHEDYYKQLCASRFGLSPTGNCPWSYRFFESIMCDAIPILGDDDNDIFAHKYTVFRDSEPKQWTVAACEQNFRLFLDHHTLSNL